MPCLYAVAAIEALGIIDCSTIWHLNAREYCCLGNGVLRVTGRNSVIKLGVHLNLGGHLFCGDLRSMARECWAGACRRFGTRLGAYSGAACQMRLY